MARPLKDGLDYFSHDVDLSEDEKILAIEQKFHDSGYAFYCKMLERIYRSPNGFIAIGKDAEWQRSALCEKFHKTLEEFNAMLTFAVEIGLFDKTIFETSGNITSNGIQKRREAVLKERDTKRKYYHDKKEGLETSGKYADMVQRDDNPSQKPAGAFDNLDRDCT